MRLSDMYYEEGLDEVLLLHNPNGGRPQKVGNLVFNDPEGYKTCEISEIREDTVQRLFLGYCTCGRKIVIGNTRASVLAKMLTKRGIVPQKVRRMPLRIRLAKRLAGVDM